MKPRVVLLFYHGLGHINALSKAAKILESNNYEVYFAGSGFFRDYILLQGFRFYLLRSYPFGLGLEEWINTVSNRKYSYFSALRDRMTDRVFKEREVELYWMLEEVKPDTILIDTLQATDFIVLYSQVRNRNIKVATINTMLPTQVPRGHPPLNSDVIPTDAGSVSKAVRRMRWDQLKKRWKGKLMRLGFDDRFIIRRRLNKNGMPSHYISSSQDLLNFTPAHVDEFILAPGEFDFQSFKQKPNQVYVGFMTDKNRIEIADTRYEEAAADILAIKNDKRLKLIYCSFGTIPSKQRNVTASLMNKLFSIAVEEHFIIIIARKSEEEILTNIPDHVYIFNSVPQLEVLKHADLFITHGGLNSIKEAIYAEIPMLVYPVHSEYDPKGNAARILHHGLGLRGNAASESVDDIRRKIKELLSNPSFKKNLRQLKYDDSLYTAEKFVDRIKGIDPLKI